MVVSKFVLATSACAVSITAFARAIFADVSPTISPDWKVDLRTVFAVGGVVVIAAWRIGRWMKRIDDRLEVGEKWFVDLDHRMNHRDARLDRIEAILARLPCQDGSPCKENER